MELPQPGKVVLCDLHLARLFVRTENMAVEIRDRFVISGQFSNIENRSVQTFQTPIFFIFHKDSDFSFLQIRLCGTLGGALECILRLVDPPNSGVQHKCGLPTSRTTLVYKCTMHVTVQIPYIHRRRPNPPKTPTWGFTARYRRTVEIQGSDRA